MTCEYDGHLVCNRIDRKIEPCCEAMHEYVIDGTVYLSASKAPQIVLRKREKTSKNRPLVCCPFCDSKVEVNG